MNLKELIGAGMISLAILAGLVLLGWVLVSMAKNLPLARAEGPLGRNLLRQQRLYASYREWRKQNRSGDLLTFDQWKEANGQ